MNLKVGKLYFMNLKYPSNINDLKSLHCDYWAGRRYSEDGSVLLDPRGGSGRGIGSASASGGSGSGSGLEGSGGGSLERNPIDPKTGLTHSARVKKAMLQERKRAVQAQIVEGIFEVEGGGEPLICTLSPLTKKTLEGLALQEQEFPCELLIV